MTKPAAQIAPPANPFQVFSPGPQIPSAAEPEPEIVLTDGAKAALVAGNLLAWTVAVLAARSAYRRARASCAVL